MSDSIVISTFQASTDCSGMGSTEILTLPPQFGDYDEINNLLKAPADKIKCYDLAGLAISGSDPEVP
eukprot:Awhi_evm1s1845